MEILTKRDVLITFPVQDINNPNLKYTGIRLPIVTSIRITHGIAIGKVFGLTRNVMQPWHAELVTIDLQGSSYIGAFQALINKKTGYREDLYTHQTYGERGTFSNTWNQIISIFLQYQDNLIDISHLYSNEPLRFEIQNDPGQPYNGFIESIDGSENVSKPFIIDYNIKFIGTSSASYNKKKAEKAAAEDTAKVTNYEQMTTNAQTSGTGA